MTIATTDSPRAAAVGAKTPRKLVPGRELSDRVFHGTSTAVGLSVLAITSAIGVFLGYQSIPTLRHYGLHFFTQANWQPELNQIGIAAVLVGTVEVALVAIAGLYLKIRQIESQ